METDSFALRILNPYEDAEVYAYKEGAWTACDYKSRGQYLQVSMTGTQGYFCVVEKKSNLVRIIACAAAAAAVVTAVLVFSVEKEWKRYVKMNKEN